MDSFAERVAAVTGAASGIGRELALELARARCHLALADLNEQGLSETAEAARHLGVRVTTERLDVADRAAMHRWADRVVADHGKVNLIFNNAGVALGSTVEGVRYEDFEWLMDINFWGVVYGTKAFLPYLKAAGEGHIINISSVFGIAGIPSQSAYNAAKFAVRGFTESLRQELELRPCGVSATSVHPGGIKTNIARAARYSKDLEEFMGVDEARSKADFEKLFITSPNAAARTILKAVRHNRRRVLVGPDAKLVDLLVRLFPQGYQRLITWGARRQMGHRPEHRD